MTLRTITFEYDDQSDGIQDLHETLCLAIHEQDLNAMVLLTDRIIDIVDNEDVITTRLDPNDYIVYLQGPDGEEVEYTVGVPDPEDGTLTCYVDPDTEMPSGKLSEFWVRICPKSPKSPS